MMQNAFKLLSLIIFSLTLTSCFCPHILKPAEVPDPIPVCMIPEKIRLALVLGGGGVKGLAHVGVLEEFEKANIPIDLIVGCSAGSVVGALYADCPDSQYVKRIVGRIKAHSILDINLLTARYGLSQGHGLHRILSRSLHARRFEQLKIPFLLVATDLYSSELVTLGGGPLIPAVKASCAIPFVYVPVELHGRVFVDGGVIDPVPVRVARKLKAEIIVAVDLRGLLPKTFPTNLFGVAERSAEITLLWQSEACIHHADVVIRPQLGDIGTFDDDHNVQIYEAGRRAAACEIPRIIELLKSKGYCI